MPTPETNPFFAFDPSLTPVQGATNQPVQNVAPPVVNNAPPVVDNQPPVDTSSSTTESELDPSNPFSGFLKSDTTTEGNSRESNSLGQASLLGAVVGGIRGNKVAKILNEDVEQKNAEALQKFKEEAKIAAETKAALRKSSGTQAYLNGMLPPNVNMSLDNLEQLTGLSVRTPEEVQAALKKLNQRPAERIPNVKLNQQGKKVTIGFKNKPAQQVVSLEPFTNVPPPPEVQAVQPATFNQPVKPVSPLSTIGKGALAGATVAPALYEMSTQEKPTDWTQWASLAGALPTILPKIASKIPYLNEISPLLSLPYAIKNREAISRGLTLGEINPTAFGGLPESLETPFLDMTRNMAKDIKQQSDEAHRQYNQKP